MVIAVATEAALRCKLYGEYILTPQSDSLLLKDYQTKQVLLTWPYRFVRKFGQDM
ncbi:docking protein 3, partial [Tachysurus ichikawai]